MKIGVLIDEGNVARWQADALRTVAKDNRFVVYDCVNRRSSRRSLRHAAYYALNLLAVRNPMTRREAMPEELNIIGRVTFGCEAEGAWERLPKSLLDRITADRPDVIVKFGMGLLRVPEGSERLCPILSYHHGDPRRFRGRPAGFYELQTGAAELGQVVQLLSNRLDAGAVLAFAETKAHPHSWRQTLIEALRISPLLLGPAIRRAIAGERMPIESDGVNYRLPSNLVVARASVSLAAAKVRRLAYGAFAEKAWQVAEADIPPGWSPSDPGALADPCTWRTLARPPRYRFLADPFYSTGIGAVLAEAMRPDGVGDIVVLAGGKCSTLPIGGRHCSYPATFAWDGRHFVMPEISQWSLPRIYELGEIGIEDRGEIAIEGAPRLVDPTLFVRGALCFLFGNRADEGDRVLRLWVAESPFGPFIEHRDSPIRISPLGARMGGGILDLTEGLYRPGQDLSRAYGDGLILFRIDELSHGSYGESEVGRLRFERHRGPHTLNIRGEKALFDYYEDRLHPLAGFRRLRQTRAR